MIQDFRKGFTVEKFFSSIRPAAFDSHLPPDMARTDRAFKSLSCICYVSPGGPEAREGRARKSGLSRFRYISRQSPRRKQISADSNLCAASQEGPSEECHGDPAMRFDPSPEVSRDPESFLGLTDRNLLHFSESDLTHHRKKVMTKESRIIAPLEFTDIVQLACLEVWGGNRRVNHPVELPGLTGWIYSEPVASAALGGDVHYISVCSHGIISRFALADVSGHGRSNSVMAQLLRKLIQKHINTWDQSELMRELNESLRNTKKNGEQYATAALFAYCRPTRELVFTFSEMCLSILRLIWRIVCSRHFRIFERALSAMTTRVFSFCSNSKADLRCSLSRSMLDRSSSPSKAGFPFATG